MSIKAVELALIDRIKQLLGARVRQVASLPGDWDDDMLKTFGKAAPGVFVAFTGGPRREAPAGVEASITAGWAVYVATAHATEQARRQGDARQIGAYDLVELLAPALHGAQLAGAGTLNLEGITNLYTGVIERQALSVYGLGFTMPMTFARAETDSLDDFETFVALYDVPPITPENHVAWLAGNTSTSAPDAADTVVLPT
jgi:phage gp37-like protein